MHTCEGRRNCIIVERRFPALTRETRNEAPAETPNFIAKEPVIIPAASPAPPKEAGVEETCHPTAIPRSRSTTMKGRCTRALLFTRSGVVGTEQHPPRALENADSFLSLTTVAERKFPATVWQGVLVFSWILASVPFGVYLPYDMPHNETDLCITTGIASVARWSTPYRAALFIRTHGTHTPHAIFLTAKMMDSNFTGLLLFCCFLAFYSSLLVSSTGGHKN